MTVMNSSDKRKYLTEGKESGKRGQCDMKMNNNLLILSSQNLMIVRR